tara:strand:+ start:16 stop:336 length:321 start_codon:yes stop_codon:yes gene_type:complete
MKIEKITVDTFNLKKEGGEYVLYMGVIEKSTTRPFILKISEVTDSSKVEINTTCGCTTAENKILDKTTLLTTLSYNRCDSVFNKTVEIVDNKRKTILKIKGSCQNM